VCNKVRLLGLLISWNIHSSCTVPTRQLFCFFFKLLA
jgi:hypothetical protein